MDKTLFSIHFEVKKSAVVALICMGVGYAIGYMAKSDKSHKKSKNDNVKEHN